MAITDDAYHERMERRRTERKRAVTDGPGTVSGRGKGIHDQRTIAILPSLPTRGPGVKGQSLKATSAYPPSISKTFQPPTLSRFHAHRDQAAWHEITPPLTRTRSERVGRHLRLIKGDLALGVVVRACRRLNQVADRMVPLWTRYECMLRVEVGVPVGAQTRAGRASDFNWDRCLRVVA